MLGLGGLPGTGLSLSHSCALPLTTLAAVDVLITDLAVFQISSGRPVLTALMPDVAVEQVRLHTYFTIEIEL